MPWSRRYLLLGLVYFCVDAAQASKVKSDVDTLDALAYETEYGYYPYRTFHSSDVVAPFARKAVDSPECHDGMYTFITPRGDSVEHPSNVVLDDDGQLVWLQETIGGQPYNLRVQEFRGEQFLSYWVGDDNVRGHGQGEYIVLNSSYEEVFRINAHNNLSADLHDLIITPQNTALITIFDYVKKDINDIEKLNYFGQPPSYIWDCLFQEIDLVENKLLFEWRASDHYFVSDTNRRLGMSGGLAEPFDYFHINSVEKDVLGNYLISARYTNSITYIDGKTGDIIWILGGVRNYFTDLSDGSAINFSYQHDARFHSIDAFTGILESDALISTNGKEGMTRKLLTLFDNAAENEGGSHNKPSRGLLLEVSYPDPVRKLSSRDVEQEKNDPNVRESHSVRLVRSFEHPSQIIAPSQGSLQVLSAGKPPKVLLDYGYAAVFTEFAANGTVLCDTRFAAQKSWVRNEVHSYRAFKCPWSGQPRSPPAAVVVMGNLYVSWNGATEVRRWAVEQSATGKDDDEEGTWDIMTTEEKQGFETRIALDQHTIRPFLRVRALDKDGKVLGLSLTIRSTGTSNGAIMTYVSGLLILGLGVTAVLYRFKGRILKWSGLRRPSRGRYRYRPVSGSSTDIEM